MHQPKSDRKYPLPSHQIIFRALEMMKKGIYFLKSSPLKVFVEWPSNLRVDLNASVGVGRMQVSVLLGCQMQVSFFWGGLTHVSLFWGGRMQGTLFLGVGCR